ncbi:MAG: hypothetical protein B6D55_04815 [Candidatus Omnitrophica bacterium 4484_70.2]|nr:MAG: hypothetical protein B6D55_04815 [Candidatus Omnitrophica bacterium 4484_70.2]
MADVRSSSSKIDSLPSRLFWITSLIYSISIPFTPFCMADVRILPAKSGFPSSKNFWIDSLIYSASIPSIPFSMADVRISSHIHLNFSRCF